MPKKRINCPNCRQSIPAEIDQLIDVGHDASLKQKFLTGMINYFECPICHYQGNFSTVLVYHDPDKELLLHYIPPELGMPINEQEKMVGNLINQVVNRLPQEKRKGYLLKSQQTLTVQGLVERVLEADGITREMIEAQQKKVGLIQKLVETNPENRVEIILQEDSLIDGEFFLIFRRLIEASMVNQDEQTSQKFNEIQRDLLEYSSYGKQLVERSSVVQKAIKDIQDIGDKLTRENLLDLCSKATNEVQVQTYVSIARPLMDYTFFQQLSEKIDRSRADGRTRLVELRTTLLDLTNQYDREIENRRLQAQKIIDQLLQVTDVERAIGQFAQNIDELFMLQLESALEQARNQGDLGKIGKLQEIKNTIEEATAPPAEVEFIESLISLETREEIAQELETHTDKVTPEFLELLAGFVSQIKEEDNPILFQKINEINRIAIRHSMVKQFNQ